MVMYMTVRYAWVGNQGMQNHHVNISFVEINGKTDVYTSVTKVEMLVTVVYIMFFF